MGDAFGWILLFMGVAHTKWTEWTKCTKCATLLRSHRGNRCQFIR